MPYIPEIYHGIFSADVDLTNEKTVLTIWTIYKHPADFPASWVLRGYDVVSGCAEPQPRQVSHVASTLDGARSGLPPGLTKLARSPDDDPVIFESWV